MELLQSCTKPSIYSNCTLSINIQLYFQNLLSFHKICMQFWLLFGMLFHNGNIFLGTYVPTMHSESKFNYLIKICCYYSANYLKLTSGVCWSWVCLFMCCSILEAYPGLDKAVPCACYSATQPWPLMTRDTKMSLMTGTVHVYELQKGWRICLFGELYKCSDIRNQE